MAVEDRLWRCTLLDVCDYPEVNIISIMHIRIENHSNAALPPKTESIILSIINKLPKEHTRGLERFRFVDLIDDPRVRNRQSQLPGLYHPKQGPQSAWAEIAINVLLPSSLPFYKRLLPRLSFKNNLAVIIFSLIGQHYYLTLRHSVKKSQLESSVRLYAEKHLKVWHERESGFLARLLKPMQPTLEKWAKSLQRRASKTKQTR